MDEREKYRRWYRAEEADNREHEIDRARDLAWWPDALDFQPEKLVHALRVLAVTLDEECELAGELAEVDDVEASWIADVTASWVNDFSPDDRSTVRRMSERLYNALGALSTLHGNRKGRA